MIRVFSKIDAFEKDVRSLSDKLGAALDNVRTREEEIKHLRRKLHNMQVALDALNRVADADDARPKSEAG